MSLISTNSMTDEQSVRRIYLTKTPLEKEILLPLLHILAGLLEPCLNKRYWNRANVPRL